MNFEVQAAWESIEGMANAFIVRLPYIVLALVVFAICYFAAKGVRKLVRKVVQRRHRHQNAALVFGRLMQATMVFLGLMLALVIALPSFKPAQLVEFLGIGTVAIGFAFRDVLQNFLAGILILITEPFRMGDQIKYEQFEGVVEDIQTRATMLRTYDGRRIVIPNANLFTNAVTVNTAFERRRLEHDIGIGYGDDIARAKEIILGELKNLEEVIKDPAPEVLVVDLAASAVTLRVRWWFTPPKRLEEVYSRDKVLEVVKRALVSNGIDLPFEVRTVLFHDQTDETDGDRARQREGWPAGKGEVPKPLNVGRELRKMISMRREGEHSGEKSTNSPELHPRE